MGEYYNGRGNVNNNRDQGEKGGKQEEKDICNTASFDLSAPYLQPGWVKIKTGTENIHFEFSVECPWHLSETYLYAGNCEQIPLSQSGGPNVHAFPYKTVCAEPRETNEYIISLSQIDSCFCMAAFAVIVRSHNNGTIQEEHLWLENGSDHSCCHCEVSTIDYCIEPCNESELNNNPDSCGLVIGDFRTQTQGGWGSEPNGNNAGIYLHNHFPSAFPAGMSIGCNHTLTFTNAQAITDFLPQGGTPVSLTQSYTDPLLNMNVLAGQMVALSLSLGFDSYDAEFGNASFPLGNLMITSGPLAGLTVNEVFDEGNKILGDCPSSFDIHDVLETLSLINQNFVDGAINEAYLNCP